MNTDLGTQYYLKAVDHFPYHLEFAIENLNYALSYDPDQVQSLTMMGNIHMYITKDYVKAKAYLQHAISVDLDYPDHFKLLGLLHVWLGEYVEAEKLIMFATKRKACNHSAMYSIKATLYEYTGRLVKAKEAWTNAKLYSVGNPCIADIEENIKRVKSKLKLAKKIVKRSRRKKN